MPEFEGSLVDERGEAEAARDDIVALDPDISSGMTRDEIELEEFPSQRQSAERTPRPVIRESCSYENGIG